MQTIETSNLEFVGTVPAWKLVIARATIEGLRDLFLIDGKYDGSTVAGETISYIDDVLETLDKELCCDCNSFDCQCEPEEAD